MIRNVQGVNHLIIFDAWTQKKAKLPLGHNYQVVDAFSYKNTLFLLDVDQKMIVVDTRFLSADKYMQFQNSSPEVLASIVPTLVEGIREYFFPVRTVNIRFDAVLTLKDYDLKNYTNIIVGRNNLMIAIAKQFLIVMDYKRFIEAPEVRQFDSSKEYCKTKSVLKMQLEFPIKKIFKVYYHEEWLIFFHAENGELFFLTEQFFILNWQEAKEGRVLEDVCKDVQKQDFLTSVTLKL